MECLFQPCYYRALNRQRRPIYGTLLSDADVWKVAMSIESWWKWPKISRFPTMPEVWFPIDRPLKAMSTCGEIGIRSFPKWLEDAFLLQHPPITIMSPCFAPLSLGGQRTFPPPLPKPIVKTPTLKYQRLRRLLGLILRSRSDRKRSSGSWRERLALFPSWLLAKQCKN